MSLRTLAVLMCLLMIGGTAVAQDAPVDPAAEAAAAEGAPAEDPAADPMAGGDTGGEMGGGEATSEAPAEEMPAEDTGGGEKPISVGLLLGFGLDLEDLGGNPWGLGFGVGGGYSLDMGLYLGARFVYYLGESNFNIWELGAEGGYEIAMDKLTIRPGVGLGLANFTVDIPTVVTPFGSVGGSSSEMYLYLAPGAAVLYDVTDSIFIGAEARLQLVFADPDMIKALIFLANGGMRF